MSIACKRTDGEKSACDAMVLGSFLQVAQKARIWPFPEPPYKGFTVDGLKKDIVAVEIQTLCDITHPQLGFKTHKGETNMNVFDPYSHAYTRGNQKLCFGNPIQQNQENVNSLKASQAIKESVASTIRSLSDEVCGLSIKEFRELRAC